MNTPSKELEEAAHEIVDLLDLTHGLFTLNDVKNAIARAICSNEKLQSLTSRAENEDKKRLDTLGSCDYLICSYVSQTFVQWSRRHHGPLRQKIDSAMQPTEGKDK